MLAFHWNVMTRLKVEQSTTWLYSVITRSVHLENCLWRKIYFKAETPEKIIISLINIFEVIILWLCLVLHFLRLCFHSDICVFLIYGGTQRHILPRNQKRRNENNKYSISLSGNRNHNLSPLQPHTCATTGISWTT